MMHCRGAMRLAVGQADLALRDIDALLASNPNDAEALALQSVLALTQNRKDEAYALANRAISSDPRSVAAYSALSYAEQGPGSRPLDLELDATLERTQTVMGFAYLLRTDIDEALHTFEKAVRLDSTSPLA